MQTHAHSRPWSQPALENYRLETAETIARSDKSVLAVMFVGDDAKPNYLTPLAQEYQLIPAYSECKPAITAFDVEDKHWIVCPLHRAAD